MAGQHCQKASCGAPWGPRELQDNWGVNAGACILLFPSMKVSRGLFLLLSCSPSGSRANLCQSMGAGKPGKGALWNPRQLPRGQGWMLGSLPFSYHHSQSIPDVWFWVSDLILRGFVLFSGNKASCSILVTHYLISTMMYEQPHKYNDAQLQYKHSHS